MQNGFSSRIKLPRGQVPTYGERERKSSIKVKVSTFLANERSGNKQKLVDVMDTHLRYNWLRNYYLFSNPFSVQKFPKCYAVVEDV